MTGETAAPQLGTQIDAADAAVQVPTSSANFRRDILLGDDHVLLDPGRRTWRLDGRYRLPRLWRRHDGVQHLAGIRCHGVLLDDLSRTVLFWAALILTRPLGTVVGDLLDKSLDAGGLAL